MFRIKDNHKNLLFLFLILSICVLIRSYRVVDKDTLFLDENLTVIMTNHGERGWAYANFDDSHSYTGSEFKSLFFKDSTSIKETLYDIYRNRMYPTDHPPHTNLFYSLVKISFLFSDTSDLSQVIQRIFILNLLLFAIGFIFMNRFLTLFIKEDYARYSLLIMMFMNLAAIGNTLFLRPYQLSETLCIICTYYFALLYLSRFNSKKDKRNTFIIFCIVGSLFSLVHYLTIIYLVLLWGILFVQLILSKSNFSLYMKFISGGLCMLLLDYLIFPYYFNPIFTLISSTSNDSTMPFVDKFIFEITLFYTKFSDVFIGNYILITILLIFILSCFFCSKSTKTQTNNKYLAQTIFIIALICTIIIYINSPFFKTVRYIVTFTPLLYLGVYLALNRIPKNTKTFCYFLLASMILIRAFYVKDVYWDKMDIKSYNEDKTIPILVLGVSQFTQLDFIPFYTNDRKVELAFSLDSLKSKINKLKRTYVVMYENDDSVDQLNTDTLNISPQSVFDQSIWGKGYLIEVK